MTMVPIIVATPTGTPIPMAIISDLKSPLFEAFPGLLPFVGAALGRVGPWVGVELQLGLREWT
jgi:hypothetical protein